MPRTNYLFLTVVTDAKVVQDQFRPELGSGVWVIHELEGISKLGGVSIARIWTVSRWSFNTTEHGFSILQPQNGLNYFTWLGHEIRGNADNAKMLSADDSAPHST
jgi:hypothetical protein